MTLPETVHDIIERPSGRVTPIAVLDLFSAAAGGWSLGMHRAGFTTVAACEAVEWRRTLYNENNPGVPVYDDVRTLTAERLLRDIGKLPSVIVGSPPCQDISSANTKGKGVEGERSGLYFEAVRLIGECRPRWFALENGANLRTRGADAVLAALEALGYAFVGGDTPWKLATMVSWARLAHERGAICHVGRVNTVRRIRLCAAAGADSFDGSGVSRFAAALPPLDLARRQPDIEGWIAGQRP